MKKLTCILLAALLIFATATAVGAETPLYSQNFESKTDMLTALADYAKDFPDIDDCNVQASEGFYLSDKEVIIPTLDSTVYTPVNYSFAEAFWNSGVNYTFVKYNENGTDNTMEFLVYYYMSEDAVSDGLKSFYVNGEQTESTHGGRVGGYTYYACEYQDGNGNTRCTYNLKINGLLVNCLTSQPFSEDFIKSISVEATGIPLPLYVQENDKLRQAIEVEFFDFCNSKIETTFEHDSVHINDYIEEEGMIFFIGGCSWIFAHEMIVYADSLGNWHFMTGPSEYGLSGLGIYVKVNGEIHTLEDAWEKGLVTDLTPASKLAGAIFYHIGDANGDKEVNVRDATALQKFIANKDTEIVSNADIRKNVLDMNKDGKVNVKDATAIQKFIAGIEI